MERKAIGVFDSGLGGLTAVKQLLTVLPQEDIVYNYFSAVYKDLAVSPEKDNRLSLDGFANYFSLPFVITSRLFKL